MVCAMAHGQAMRMRTALPRGLGHPRDLTVVGELAQTDAAEPELAIHRLGPSAAVAASIGTRLVLRSPRLLDAQRGLGHQSVVSWSVVLSGGAVSVLSPSARANSAGRP